MLRKDVAVLSIATVLAGACGLDTPGAKPDGTTTPLPIPTVTTVVSTTQTPPTSTTSTTTTTPAVTSTLAPSAVFEVARPAPDERVSDRRFLFEGTAPVDVTVVAAGKYQVEIAADGTWSIELVLAPGGNVATFDVVDSAGIETVIDVPVYYDPPLDLHAGGLGSIPLRMPMNAALERLDEVLGPRDRDIVVTTETLPTEELREYRWGVFVWTGYPAHDYARFVSWDKAGLLVMFSDAGPDGTAIAPEFNGWIAQGSGTYGAVLTTDAGVAVGGSVADLIETYGDDLVMPVEPDPLTESWHFAIEGGTAPDQMPGLRGRFDGDPSRSGNVIDRFEGGLGFDEC